MQVADNRMKTIKFIVGKTATGFDAYAEKNGIIVAVTTGADLTEIRNNAVEAYNFWLAEQGKLQITGAQLKLEFDLASFFEFYKEINARSLAKRIGMNQTLLSQYVNGIKKPSDKQVQKILAGVRQLGRELTELELV
jgi:hypothetical protein